jgi:hypothetical protein
MKFCCGAKKSLILGAVIVSLAISIIGGGMTLAASRSDAAASRFGRGGGVMIAEFIPMADGVVSSDDILWQ